MTSKSSETLALAGLSAEGADVSPPPLDVQPTAQIASESCNVTLWQMEIHWLLKLGEFRVGWRGSPSLAFIPERSSVSRYRRGGQLADSARVIGWILSALSQSRSPRLLTHSYLCFWLEWTLGPEMLLDVIRRSAWFTVRGVGLCMRMLLTVFTEWDLQKACLLHTRWHQTFSNRDVLIGSEWFLAKEGTLNQLLGAAGSLLMICTGRLKWKRKHSCTCKSLTFSAFDVRGWIVVGLRQSPRCQKQGWRLRQVHRFITSWWKRHRAKLLFSTCWKCLFTDGDIRWQTLPHFVQKVVEWRGGGKKNAVESNISFPMARRTSL